MATLAKSGMVGFGTIAPYLAGMAAVAMVPYMYTSSKKAIGGERCRLGSPV